jgi:hypothetical protein
LRGFNPAPYPLWNARMKALMLSWIAHRMNQINRTGQSPGSRDNQGGIDNFMEAGKKLRGDPHGLHKGYVFSRAGVHQTVEAMRIALMIDPQGETDIIRAQANAWKADARNNHPHCSPTAPFGKVATMEASFPTPRR